MKTGISNIFGNIFHRIDCSDTMDNNFQNDTVNYSKILGTRGFISKYQKFKL